MSYFLNVTFPALFASGCWSIVLFADWEFAVSMAFNFASCICVVVSTVAENLAQ